MAKSVIELNLNSNNHPKPIFRWAGGKRWLIKYLRLINLPKYNNYHEPFFGGGSIFFHLKPYNKSYLSDINKDLILAYKEIKKNPLKLLNKVTSYNTSRHDYEKIRKIKVGNQFQRAARFMYLNKLCYNGIYRVNRNGEFNVPYGKRNLGDLYYDENNLLNIQKSLKNVILDTCDFYKTLPNIKRNDLVFLDPPYTVAHTKNGFIEYNEKIFAWSDQERLADYISNIKRRKAFYILTNAKHDSIKDLFGQFDQPIILSRYSSIGGINAKRGRFDEYIFSNIDLGGINVL